MTETRSASITINPPRKAVVSIGWAYDDVAPGCVFDSGLGINRMNYSATARTFVWDSGEDAGTVVKGDSVNFNEDIRSVVQLQVTIVACIRTVCWRNMSGITVSRRIHTDTGQPRYISLQGHTVCGCSVP